MNQKIIVKRLTHRSLLRIAAVAAFTTLVPFGFFMGIFALFGFQTVRFNDQYLTGIVGLFGGIAIGVFVSVFFTLFFATLGFVGVWLYSKFRPLEIEYVEYEQDGRNSSSS